VVAAGLEQSAEFVRANPQFRVVTAAGDLIGAHWARGGSAGGQSLLDVRAAADEAAAKFTAAELASEAAAEALATATEAQETARQELEEIRGRMRAVDAAAAEISGRLGRLAGPREPPPTRPSGSTPPWARPSAARRRTRPSSRS
jgi:chromosome segregation protein